MRALAASFSVVARASTPEYALSTPSIAVIGNRYILSFDEYRRDRTSPLCSAMIVVSDNNGVSWVLRHTMSSMHGRLFVVDGAVYYLGQANDIVVARSTDCGESWSALVPLTEGQAWHQSASNVLHTKDAVYLVMERRVTHIGDTWFVPWLAPVLLRAQRGSNLLERQSWTMSGELPFCELIPGYKQNQPMLDFFGVPFFAQQYPLYSHLGGGRKMHPIGWLEGNVIQILDPKHYWYDPDERTFHIFLRAHTGGTGYAALLKVVQHLDGSMTPTLEVAPSGKRILFLPFPGGHLRFHVLYDKVTQLYWLLSNQATDSMSRIESMPSLRSNLPNNERNRLALHFSRNMVDWCFAGVVAITANEVEVRTYPSMEIDQEDLLIAVRSGDRSSLDARDVAMITMHRVRAFRKLVY